MIDWDYERSRCWFPGSSEATPADLPAEERPPQHEDETLARGDRRGECVGFGTAGTDGGQA
jgi:hypothetical protein